MFLLIYYRGHSKFLYIRLFLVIAMCVLLITIIWVYTMYNKNEHYILAFFIFIMLIIYIFLTSIVIYQGLTIKTKTIKIILYLLPILAILGFLGLTFSINNVINENAKELFPSAENYMIFIQILSILSLGFI